MATTVPTNHRLKPSCPCCAFLQEDLFLPPVSQGNTNNKSDATGAQEGEMEVVTPLEALKCISQHAQQIMVKQNGGKETAPILLVDTHNHAHLRRERHVDYISEEGDEIAQNTSLISLTMAVEMEDWEDALRYSAAEPMRGKDDDPSSTNTPLIAEADRTLMGLGIHPWYLADLPEESVWKERLEFLLNQHTSAVIGEIGLCKMAKCARSHPEGKARGFELQRSVLEAQLQLAIRHRRPVSIHCVQQHGVFLDLLKEMIADKAENNTDPSLLVPPAMAMHSFTGTAHHVKALLQWEATLFDELPSPNEKKKRKQKNESLAPNSSQDPEAKPPPRRPLLYFGFSHIINWGMCTSQKARRQGREAVRAVPLDRLLAESDVHHPKDVASGTAGAIAFMASALELPITQVAEITARNGLAFLQSHIIKP
jgi:Tat protein secretion system quality control protein TatD with DNase activity